MSKKLLVGIVSSALLVFAVGVYAESSFVTGGAKADVSASANAAVSLGVGGGADNVSPDASGKCPDSYLLTSKGGGGGGKVCLKVSVLPPTSVGGGSVSAGGGSSAGGETPKVKGSPLGSGIAGAPRVDAKGNCPDPKLWKPGPNGICLKTQVPAVFLDANKPQEVIFSGAVSSDASGGSAGGGGGSISIKDVRDNQTLETVTPTALKVFTRIGGQTVTVESDGVDKKLIGSGSYSAKPDCELYLSLCKAGDNQSCAKYESNCRMGVAVTAETTEEVNVSDKKVLVNDKEVKVMPDTAAATALTVLGDKYEKIELKDTGKLAPVYEVTGTTMAKFLGLIEVKLTTKAEVDGATGELVKVKKPWWSFLAF